jgi:hypothetical protein
LRPSQGPTTVVSLQKVVPSSLLTAEQLCLDVFADGFKDAHEWLCEVVVQVVLHVNGQVVLEGIDGVLCLLIRLGT